MSFNALGNEPLVCQLTGGIMYDCLFLVLNGIVRSLYCHDRVS